MYQAPNTEKGTACDLSGHKIPLVALGISKNPAWINGQSNDGIVTVISKSQNFSFCRISQHFSFGRISNCCISLQVQKKKYNIITPWEKDIHSQDIPKFVWYQKESNQLLR